MKKEIILLTIGVSLLAGCNNNLPELNENNRKMLLGQWEVVKETVTNGDGFGGVFTREGDKLLETNIYDFSDNQVTHETSTIYSSYHGYISNTYDYTLDAKDKGKWLVTIIGIYDKQRNLEGGRSPITIHKLTKNAMEWEYETYGGDEGPVVYYQYLKHK